MSDPGSTLSAGEKRRLLAQLLEEEASQPERFPLSFGQQRLWFLDQLDPGNPAYNNWLAVRLEGDLDRGALQAVVAEIVRRHEVLRTTFQTDEGEPYQVVSEELHLTLSEIDLSRLSASSRELEVAQLARSEAAHPFDLPRGPLIRVHLLRLGENDSVLLVCIHHIVSDAWSLGILIRELAALYKERNQESGIRSQEEGEGTGSARIPAGSGFRSPVSASEQPTANCELLPPLPIQYADFAVWQREELEGEALDSQLDYWKQDLAGHLPSLELPLDRPRPALQTTSGAAYPVRLPAALLADFKALLQHEGATLFMGLLAAFQALLHRYSGQDDILVGTPIANRPRVELEGLIGLFVNTLVLRSSFSEDPAFSDFLRRVREKTIAAFDCQDVPFERLVEELHPERDLSRSPLFQVQFVLQSADLGREYRLPGLSLRPFPVDDRTAQFDLTLDVSESEGGLRGWIRYNRDLFDRSSIARLERHFRCLTASITANPQQTISRLALIEDAERHQLLQEWGCGPTVVRPDAPLHHWIDRQAQRTPDAAALVFEDSHLSYSQLDRRTSQLAHQLRNHGVTLESCVGVLMDRSLEMALALVSILKAGAAYLPLDPNHPARRLSLILEDSLFSPPSANPSAPSAVHPPLLTQHHLADKLSAPSLSLDTDYPQSEHHPFSAPVPPNSAAYLIYTSGSTGLPKGALNTHQAILNRLLWMQDQYRLTSRDRVFQKTPYTFDVSVWEFFWPLMTGACLVIARPEGHKDAAYLVDQVVEQQVTLMHFVPSMLQAFVEQPGLERCRTLRQVVVSGEALPKELQERYFERLNCPLDNLYGPTEAAVDVTVWPCRPWGAYSSVPIGRPIANLSIRILDRSLQPTPAGVPGELHIGGAGLARGYRNRASLSAEKFIPDSFSDRPGARLYRSGDRTRFLPGGEIEFLGRLDFQVKLRGLRIELGEIEAVMGQHPGVHQAAVVVHDERLVGYVSRRSQEEGRNRKERGGTAQRGAEKSSPRPLLSASSAVHSPSLRSHLQAHLPEYMIPAQFVLLEEMPLTPSGKLDRKRLPAPERAEDSDERPFVQPETPTQTALAGMWAELLPVERIGLEDDFFDLGGHSLMATRLNARVERHLGVRLTLREIFQYPTLGGLAKLIDERKLPEVAEDEELTAILDELEGLSAEEVEAVLEESRRLSAP
ncbi:MAG: amino acid adenylation domain-containing protein [Acidobacteriota bacterium]